MLERLRIYLPSLLTSSGPTRKGYTGYIYLHVVRWSVDGLFAVQSYTMYQCEGMMKYLVLHVSRSINVCAFMIEAIVHTTFIGYDSRS